MALNTATWPVELEPPNEPEPAAVALGGTGNERGQFGGSWPSRETETWPSGVLTWKLLEVEGSTDGRVMELWVGDGCDEVEDEPQPAASRSVAATAPARAIDVNMTQRSVPRRVPGVRTDGGVGRVVAQARRGCSKSRACEPPVVCVTMGCVDMDDTMVIVGAGMAGGNAAVTLREEGFAGRVMLLGEEPGVPFGRPPLSKTYLRGEEDLTGWLVRQVEWYEAHDVDLRPGPGVAGIDAAAGRVSLASGESFDYRALLIATGARNRRLAIPGADLPGVHALRTVADCDAIRRAASPGRHAVVVGMGFIGSEVAASLRIMGLRVTVVLPGRVPLESVVGPQVGEALASIHRERGVGLLTGDQAVAFEGREALEAVVTRGAGRVPCDLAVIGVGVEPEVRVAETAGVAIDDGVLVDERCRTSVPHVYAAGDVARHQHPLFGRVRVEHYNNAEKQGRHAARSMLGETAPYDYVHSFWSDQYDHTVEYVGFASRWDRFVMRGSVADRRFLGFYLLQGTLRAAVGLDRGGDPELEPDSELAACAAMIGARATPSPDVLADERVELRSLALSGR